MAINQRGFNIDEFRSLVTRNGIARNNQYKVILTPPRSILTALPGLANPNLVEDIMLYAESIQLPGLSLATSPIRNNGYGPVEYKPYMPIYGQTIPFVFYVDTNGLLFDFFHTWMRTIINYTTEGRSFTRSRFSGMSPFEVNYKPNYQTDMDILVLDQEDGGKIVKQYRVMKAFPVQIPDTPLSYNSTDSILTLTVMFSFFEWHTLKLASPDSVPGPNMQDDGVPTTPPNLTYDGNVFQRPTGPGTIFNPYPNPAQNFNPLTGTGAIDWQPNTPNGR